MKLKDGLILREVAGQYVIVPTGKRVQEVTNIVYISSSAAYLWEYMKDHEFEKEDLVKRIMEHYIGVTEEKAAEDVEKFLKILADNNIMEDGVKRGGDFTRIPKEMLDKLWPSNGMSEKDTGDEVD
ncbi:PqqD family protein [Mediterraneibacter glycyrrhizinilyticus]|nr:PqqD family protein [Mediterraneibacter glycyrrhizinilyticus]MBM6854516.1 PqqD family protein [Mediterraneibacter glycyrrhizinilyticus]